MRTAIFVDGSNLAAMDLPYPINYDRLRDHFPGTFMAKYFTALPERLPEDDPRFVHNPLFKAVDYLSYNRWNLISKPVKQWRDESGQMRIKGNMDIEICIHALQIAPKLDHFVLVSGDGDFRILVEEMQRHGCSVTCMATRELASDDIRRQANDFIYLETMREYLSRDSKPNPVERFRNRIR